MPNVRQMSLSEIIGTNNRQMMLLTKNKPFLTFNITISSFYLFFSIFWQIWTLYFLYTLYTLNCYSRFCLNLPKTEFLYFIGNTSRTVISKFHLGSIWFNLSFKPQHMSNKTLTFFIFLWGGRGRVTL